MPPVNYVILLGSILQSPTAYIINGRLGASTLLV